MPSDWITFEPTYMPKNSKHLTVVGDAVYLTKNLFTEMGSPEFIKVKINEKQKAVAITASVESDRASLRVTQARIKNTELAKMLLAVFNVPRISLKGRLHSNGKTWLFQATSLEEKVL